MYSKILVIPQLAFFINLQRAGRYRPVSYPDGPIMARYRFTWNANWDFTVVFVDISGFLHCSSSSFVPRQFHAWRLFCHCLFLFYSSFSDREGYPSWLWHALGTVYLYLYLYRMINGDINCSSWKYFSNSSQSLLTEENWSSYCEIELFISCIIISVRSALPVWGIMAIHQMSFNPWSANHKSNKRHFDIFVFPKKLRHGGRFIWNAKSYYEFVSSLLFPHLSFFLVPWEGYSTWLWHFLDILTYFCLLVW